MVETADSDRAPGRNRVQQPKLFHLDNPLSARLGNAFFISIPRAPGVYFFHGDDDRLLYIGQSSDLRSRLGSYRHVCPERHPKRTLRLVARVRKIVWQTCTDAAEAVALESSLLKEHRPPFNRAGVWTPSPWWLKMETTPTKLRLELVRTPDESESLGPFPSWLRHGLGLLVRCLYRATLPGVSLSEFPRGLFTEPAPLTMVLEIPDSQQAKDILRTCLTGNVQPLETQLTQMPPSPLLAMQEWSHQELDSLRKLGPKLVKAWAALQQKEITAQEDDGPHSP